MICVRRRRRFGESGQVGILETISLGIVLLAVPVVILFGGGAWAAATYDQHHSQQALVQQPASQPTHPSVSFTDFSPVGLHEDCILKVAAGLGLTWDGGALGWTSGANPRLRGSDGLNDQKVQDWRNRMSAELGAAANSADWKACSLPQLPPPLPQSPQPADTMAVDGQYTIDPTSVQAIGGCGSGVDPLSMTVSGNGTSITIVFNGTGQARTTLTGTLDAASQGVDASLTDPDGTKHTLHGSFSSNAGVTRFQGEYATVRDPAGCGYVFSAVKS